MTAKGPSDTVKLYIGRHESHDLSYYLADEGDMEDALYVELSRKDAEDYFAYAEKHAEWQKRLMPLYVETRRKMYADRNEAEERAALARLKAKYEP